MATRKRTIDAFFGSPAAKKAKASVASSSPRATSDERACPRILSPLDIKREISATGPGFSEHYTYPFPIAHLPDHISAELSSLPSSLEKVINDQPDLDLVYYEPYIPRSSARDLFRHLRSSLPFYRVEYDIQRGGFSTHIRTPRWTTVFGLDETSRFVTSPTPATTTEAHEARGTESTSLDFSTSTTTTTTIIDTKTLKPVNLAKEKLYTGYTHPRPIPKCLDDLRLSTERATGCTFNFCLVNYYASGADSISYHSDDERFLGDLPAIASFSLGARRDFMLKHKPPPATAAAAAAAAAMKDKVSGTVGSDAGGCGRPKDSIDTAKPIKLPLGSGDMILMRGTTQANWLHSIPKRSGKNEADGGRINITFRRAMVKGGTDNYYRYNVGNGPVYTWDEANQEMRPWKKNT